MTKWEKLSPVKGRGNPCLNCQPIYPTLKMNRRVAVGFGMAGVTKDGAEMWSEPNGDYSWHDLPTLQTFENMARKDPDHDWRAFMFGPLHGEEYQRHGRNLWVLVKEEDGFA